MKGRSAALALLAVGSMPGTAQARVALVATQTPELPLIDLTSGDVVAGSRSLDPAAP
jgi:hypothetical protein